MICFTIYMWTEIHSISFNSVFLLVFDYAFKHHHTVNNRIRCSAPSRGNIPEDFLQPVRFDIPILILARILPCNTCINGKRSSPLFTE
jgi:hypothetical protein